MAERDEFFIGWAAPEGALRSFLLGIGVGLIILFAGLGYLVAATQDDPGNGSFAGRVAATGVVEALPYPVLHVTDSNRFSPGDTVLLYGAGKRGVAERVAPFDGQTVALRGQRIQRGDIGGIQLAGRAFEPQDTNRPVPAAELLGDWRLTGEICDGKCYVGAMRPGRGLAHKACANLCINAGLPPVFVTNTPVEGSTFFLLADREGGPLGPEINDFVALLVSVEGRLERRGNLMVFAINPETLQKVGQ